MTKLSAIVCSSRSPHCLYRPEPFPVALVPDFCITNPRHTLSLDVSSYHNMVELLFWLSRLSAAIAGFLLLLLLSLLQWVLSTLRPQNFPPGPPVIPGLGNLHQIPPSKPFLKFHEWSKQYGDLVSLKTAAGNLVITNNPKIVRM